MPHYNLDDLHGAVRRNSVQLSRGADRDRLNLGYSLADVYQCLLALRVCHFRETHPYDDGPCDDYLLSWPHLIQDGETTLDALYIKVKLTTDPKGELVAVVSFHLQK